MDSNEFYDYEDRRYVNPTLSSGEQEQFINNFRDVQNRNNQQIATDTYNLGKALPSNLGGLGGGESYFDARYQNNQVDDMVANLDTAAKAQALSDVMTNYQDQLKKRYTVAQRNYNRRHSSSGGNYTTGDNDGTGDDELEFNTNEQKSGGLWDSWLGKKTADWMSKVLSGGKVNENTNSRFTVNNNGTMTDNKTGNVLGTPSNSLEFLVQGGGLTLGVWPNGQKMTDGSTYSFGNRTYAVTYDSAGNRNIYEVK